MKQLIGFSILPVSAGLIRSPVTLFTEVFQRFGQIEYTDKKHIFPNGIAPMQHISTKDRQSAETIETRQRNLIASVVHFFTEATHQCHTIQGRVEQYH